MIHGRLSAPAQLTMPWRFGEPFFMKEITSSPFGASLRSDPKLMHEITRALYLSDPLDYCYQLWAAVEWSNMPWLWSLRQPMLILSGGDDPLVPLANAKIMQNLIPQAQLYVYNGGHLGLMTHAKELTGVIEQFVIEGELKYDEWSNEVYFLAVKYSYILAFERNGSGHGE